MESKHKAKNLNNIILKKPKKEVPVSKTLKDSAKNTIALDKPRKENRKLYNRKLTEKTNSKTDNLVSTTEFSKKCSRTFLEDKTQKETVLKSVSIDKMAKNNMDMSSSLEMSDFDEILRNATKGKRDTHLSIFGTSNQKLMNADDTFEYSNFIKSSEEKSNYLTFNDKKLNKDVNNFNDKIENWICEIPSNVHGLHKIESLTSDTYCWNELNNLRDCFELNEDKFPQEFFKDRNLINFSVTNDKLSYFESGDLMRFNPIKKLDSNSEVYSSAFPIINYNDQKQYFANSKFMVNDIKDNDSNEQKSNTLIKLKPLKHKNSVHKEPNGKLINIDHKNLKRFDEMATNNNAKKTPKINKQMYDKCTSPNIKSFPVMTERKNNNGVTVSVNKLSKSKPRNVLKTEPTIATKGEKNKRVSTIDSRIDTVNKTLHTKINSKRPRAHTNINQTYNK